MDSYVYDEDISENRFFLALQEKESELYATATSQRWMICVPCATSLGSYTSYNDEDFMNHILQPSGGSEDTYKTLSDKTVTIQGNAITCGEGFREIKTAHILFEETFFNDADESYRVLCLDIPLEGGPNEMSNQVQFVTLQNFDDCTELLFGHSDNDRTQKQVSKVIELFLKTYRSDVQSLRHHIDATHTLFTKAVQIVMKDSHLKANARHNKAFMDNIKKAVETYVLHCVYKRVFKGICTYYAKQDASLNKINRNLADLQFKDLKIRPEFKRTIPKARTELGLLVRYSTPLGKLSCLKRVVTTLTQSGSEEAMSSDDLLPILVFLVVKADIPNWLANLAFMTKFRFSSSSTNDEYQFYLSSMEAAIEYVRSGHLDKRRLGKTQSFRMEMATPTRQLSDPASSAQGIERFFQLAADGSHDDMMKMLAANQLEAEDIKLQLCHPLCSCDRCEGLQARTRDEDAAVTVFSRDDRGFTALHAASLHGHSPIVSSLIEKGSVVNATDYHGSTPLHLACQKGHLNITLLLLHFGADLNIAENDGNTPLHLASSNGHEECVQALIFNQKNLHVEINAGNDFGDTALHLAAKWGYVDIVDILLQQGASAQVRNRRKMTPLNCSHNVQVSRLLVEAVTNSDEYKDFVHLDPQLSTSPPTASDSLIDRKPRTASTSSMPPPESDEQVAQRKALEKLVKAIGDSDLEMVKFHLGWSEDYEDDLDIDVSSRQLCHPLCQCEKCAPLQKLTSSSPSGIHVNSTNNDGSTPMHLAAQHGDCIFLELFVKRGGIIDAKNNAQQTPLHVACQYSQTEAVSYLIDHAAKVNLKDYLGRTPLYYCALNGCDKAAFLLVQNEANVNLASIKGNTPLHESARLNFITMVELLLEHGAQVNSRNKQNLIPEQLTDNVCIIRILAKPRTKSVLDKDGSLAKRSSSIKRKPIGKLTKRPSIQEIFGSMEHQNLQKLQGIVHAVQTFDRRSSLRHSALTRDRSSPQFDQQLLHQLLIQHFDQKKLRHIQPVKHSYNEGDILEEGEEGEEIAVFAMDEGDTERELQPLSSQACSNQSGVGRTLCNSQSDVLDVEAQHVPSEASLHSVEHIINSNQLLVETESNQKLPTDNADESSNLGSNKVFNDPNQSSDKTDSAQLQNQCVDESTLLGGNEPVNDPNQSSNKSDSAQLLQQSVDESTLQSQNLETQYSNIGIVEARTHLPLIVGFDERIKEVGDSLNTVLSAGLCEGD